MAQGSRQIQSQAQQQIQTLSPQQILVVKLLELPAVELEDRIHAELLENPALEEGKEDAATDEYADGVSPEEGMDNDANDYDSLSDYLTEDDIPDYKLQENNRSRDEQAEHIRNDSQQDRYITFLTLTQFLTGKPVDLPEQENGDSGRQYGEAVNDSQHNSLIKYRHDTEIRKQE